MQRDFDTAIAVRADGFFRRCPEYCVLRYHDANIARKAAVYAWTQVGVPRYGLLDSLRVFPHVNRKDNCVSFVRHCYKNSGIADPRWIRPDSVYRFQSVSGFRAVAHFRYDNYEVPENFYEGVYQ